MARAQAPSLEQVLLPPPHASLVQDLYATLQNTIQNGNVEIDGTSLNISTVVAVSCHAVAPALTSDPVVTKPIDDSVALMLRLLDEGKVVYGVNTGYGGSADTRSSQFESLQAALLQHHHFGILTSADRGLPSNVPASTQSAAMPPEWVKGTMLVRSNTIARGHSAVSLQAIESVMKLLREDVTPVIPLRGSISASGDLSPLSYVAGIIAGNPDIYARTPSGIVSAKEALDRLGVPPTVLGPKEGLGFMNGTATSAAVASLALYETHHIALLSQILTAMASEALLASADSFDHFLSEIRPHRGQSETASNIRRIFRGSRLVREVAAQKEVDTQETPGSLYQERYAIRTSPQWIGPQLEELLLAHEQITVELNSTTDNPLLDVRNGRTHHGGNFQAAAVTSAMEKTRLSLQMLGKMLFAQSSELINPTLNNGLPPNLAADEPSLSFTMKGVDIGMASYMSELAFLANPISSHVQSAEMHNQAINSLALESARYTANAVEVTSMMCASYIYTVCQALDLRVMQTVFLQSLKPKIYNVNEQYLSPLLCDSDLKELQGSIWDHLQETWLQTANKDSEDRCTNVVDSIISVIVKGLLAATPRAKTAGATASVILTSISQWKVSAHKTIAETLSMVRSDLSAKQVTAGFLGSGSRTLYTYVRETLQVPLHRGLKDHPEPHDMFAADGTRKRTIGSNISIIYEALRSGEMHKVITKCFANDQSTNGTTSTEMPERRNDVEYDTASAKSSTLKHNNMHDAQTQNGAVSAIMGENESSNVKAKRRRSSSLGQPNDKKRTTR
ncbi:MAG: hypothetical protein Q9186_002736 [Xanthomendoza sp. 1 TL-2023]